MSSEATAIKAAVETVGAAIASLPHHPREFVLPAELQAAKIARAPWLGKTHPIATRLATLLAHVQAGPDKARVLDELYVHAPDDEHTPDSLDLGAELDVNRGPKAAEILFSHIVDVAHRSRQRFVSGFESAAARGRDRLYLVSAKGTGKTIFLNWFMSSFAARLHEARIIWVRVDLTKPVARSTLSVQQRIQLQTIEILKRFYFENDEYRGAVDNDKDAFSYAGFREFLAQRESTKNEGGATESSRLVSRMRALPRIPEPLDEETGKDVEILFRGLWQYISSEHGYGFLFVLDGLDAIHPDTDAEQDFERWLAQARSVADFDPRFPGALLIAMRDRSFSSLERESPRDDNCCILHLADVSMADILEKRLSQQYTAMRKVSVDDREFLKTLIEKLLELVGGQLGGLSASDVPDVLRDLFRRDAREVLRFLDLLGKRFINAIALDFGAHILADRSAEDAAALSKLTDLIQGSAKWSDFSARKGYLVLEVLSLGAYDSYHPPLLFRKRTDSLVTKRSESDSRLAEFLPNIFWFSTSLSRDVGFASYAECIFLKPATLFCVNGFRDAYGSEASEDELAERFESTLGIPIALFESTMRELEYFRLISRNEAFDEPRLSVTEAGKLFLNSIAPNSTYLMSIASTIRLPTECWKQISFLEDFGGSRGRSSTLNNGLVLALKLRTLSVALSVLEFYAPLADERFARLDFYPGHSLTRLISRGREQFSSSSTHIIDRAFHPSSGQPRVAQGLRAVLGSYTP